MLETKKYILTVEGETEQWYFLWLRDQINKVESQTYNASILFCGRKCDRIKAILKEPDGIVMIYKRLTAQGSYRWPRNKSEVRNLTWREFDWLMSGIDIEQPKAIKAT